MMFGAGQTVLAKVMRLNQAKKRTLFNITAEGVGDVENDYEQKPDDAVVEESGYATELLEARRLDEQDVATLMNRSCLPHK